MPLGTFIRRDFSVLLVRSTEAPRMSSTDEGGAQKHRRRKRLHAPSVRMFPGTLMGAEARDGYVPMSPSATAIGPSGMGQSSVHSKKTRARGPFSSIRVYGTRPRAANTKTIYQLRLVEPIERPIRKSLRRPPAGASSPIVPRCRPRMCRGNAYKTRHSDLVGRSHGTRVRSHTFDRPTTQPI